MQDTSPQPIKCEFIPRWGRNPYHRQLIECLEARQVQVGAGRELKDLAAAVRNGERRPDIVHLHATPPFGLGPVRLRQHLLFHLRLARLRRAGAKIIWTIHDVYPHESKWEAMDMWCGRKLANWADYCIVHAPSALEAICQRWKTPGLPRVALIPHGNYLKVYPDNITREEARQKLGIEPGRMVYLFLGLIRPYKGVEVLLDVFSGMGDRKDAMLLLAGEPVNETIREVINTAAARDSRIKFFPGYAKEEELQVYMNAADVVVFPYRNSLTSGSVIMAMGFRKACIAPKLGAIKDALDDQGAYMFDPVSGGSLKVVLESAYADRSKLAAMGEHNHERCKAWSWEMIAEKTADVYRKCLGL